jgi:coatomer protein complex subunit gamma
MASSVDASTSASPAPTASETQSAYASQLVEVPEFAEYGQVLRSSSKPVELTERETEYVVTSVKHIFADHVVFQFNVRNTVDAVHLENVVVVMQPGEETEDLVEDFIIPASSVGPNSDGVVYVSFSRTNPSSYATGSFGNTLKFISKEVDPESGEPEEEGYDDEYQLEEIDVGAGDYIVPSYAAFATEWDRLRTGANAQETFALTALDSLKTACDTLLDLLGMEALGGTEAPASATVHPRHRSGLLAGGGGKGLARARMTFQTGQGVTMELTVRAEQEAAAQLVLNAIA